jgi:hypothetical protein
MRMMLEAGATGVSPLILYDFFAARESERGTNRTSSDVRLESAFRGKADYMCSERVFRLLTHLGQRPAFSTSLST